MPGTAWMSIYQGNRVCAEYQERNKQGICKGSQSAGIYPCKWSCDRIHFSYKSCEHNRFCHRDL
eukprot:scaffold227_cov165-Amphora_coffeaeformis.AAC.2